MAPRAGFEPATLFLQILLLLPKGLDYLITQKGVRYIVSTHLHFRDLARDWP